MKSYLTIFKTRFLSISSVLLLLFSSIGLSQFLPTLAYAVPQSKLNLSSSDQATSVAYYDDLLGCFYKQARLTIPTTINNPSDATPTNISWFQENNAKGYVFGQEQSCNTIATSALQLWGFKSDGSDFLTQIGYTLNSSAPNYTAPSNQLVAQKFGYLLQSIDFNSNFNGDAPINGASLYYAYLNTLNGSVCNGKDLGLLSSVNSTQATYAQNNQSSQGLNYTTINIPNGDGSVSKHVFTYSSNSGQTYVLGEPNLVPPGINDSLRNRVDCSIIVKDITSNAPAAALDFAQQSCASTFTNQVQIISCADGMTNKSNVTYCINKYSKDTTAEAACFSGQGYGNGIKCAQNYSNSNDLQACLVGSSTGNCSQYSPNTPQQAQQMSSQDNACQIGIKYGPGTVVKIQTVPTTLDCSKNSSTPGCPTNSPTSCGINGIGWIICPVLTFLGSLNDQLYGYVSNVLETNPTLVSTKTSSGVENPTYTIWQQIQSIANIAFIIVFLIIIFSQLTGSGVSNYGVKKLLPRLIVGVILVNISFYISQIAVDLSNILGGSLYGMFNNITSLTTTNANISSDATGNALGWTAIVGTIIGLGVAAYLSIAVLIPIIITAFVSVVVIVMMLIGRQAFIIFLVIISPLAFVAFLLPNTQSWFTKWRKMFTSLLVLYPIIAVVFGASKLAAYIINTTAAGNSGGTTNTDLIQLTAIGVEVIPLIAVPFLLKTSLNGLGKIGGMISSRGMKLAANAGNKYAKSDFGRFQVDRMNRRKAVTRAGEYSGRNPFRRGISSINAALNRGRILNNPVLGDYGTSRGKSAKRLESEEIAKKAENYANRLDSNGLPEDPKTIFDEAFDKYQREYNDPKTSNAKKRDLRIDLAAAQAHLIRSEGRAGAEYARKKLEDQREKNRNNNSNVRPPMPIPNPNTSSQPGGSSPRPSTPPPSNPPNDKSTNPTPEKPKLSFGSYSGDPSSPGTVFMNHPANHILDQVKSNGGWGNVSNEDVWAAMEHAEKLHDNSIETNTLGSEAIDELKKRNILPGGPDYPKPNTK